MARGVDDQVADDQLRREHLAPTASECAQPCQQLAEVEGLGEVVVGAGVEPGDALLDCVERGEHQNGNRVLGGAYRSADVEARHPRHEDVEDDDVVAVLAGERQRVRAVGGEVDDERRLAKPAGDGRTELTIILGEQDAHGREWRKAREG